MDKNYILAEIKRTAEANGGRALGYKRFESETGIKHTDWFGKHWVRWSDAVREAGCTPNQRQKALEEGFLLEKLILLIRKLGHFPLHGELRMKEHEDASFPSHSTYARLGKKNKIAAKVVKYCEKNTGYQDVIEICAPLAVVVSNEREETTAPETEVLGFVYLLKAGQYYKIGRSNAVGRRERELAIQLPEPAKIVHAIKTDDPAGIEVYWHNRFADRRKRGEWFDLSPGDVAVFKRRKFM